MSFFIEKINSTKITKKPFIPISLLIYLGDNMKKIIIILMMALTVFTVCACSVTNPSYDEETRAVNESTCSDTEKEVKTEDIVSIPSGSVMPILFDNEEELKDAILGKSTLSHEPWDPEHINSIEYYFVPEHIPENSSLSYITVHSANVVFCYEFDQAPDEWLSNVVLIEWFRTLEAGDMEKNVKSWFSEDELEQYGHYDIYIYKVFDETSKKEYIRKDVFWEQDGYAFHAIIPVSFTNTDIEKYCVAKRVVVE